MNLKIKIALYRKEHPNSTWNTQSINEYLSGNWKTMPTLSGCKGSGDLICWSSSPYLCTYIEPDVGLLNPAISCMENVQDKKTSLNKVTFGGWKEKNYNEFEYKDKIKRNTCNKVVFPLPLRPNIKPKLQKIHVKSTQSLFKCISAFEILVSL